MSVVPPAIPDVGATTQRLSQNPRFDPLKAGFGTEEYFVWSRFDGATTLKDLILMTGLPTARAIEIVRGLWRRGAILAPGEDAAAALGRGTGSVAAARPSTTPSVPRTTTPPAPARTPASPPASRVPTPPPSVARTRTTMPPPMTRSPTQESMARPGTNEGKRVTRPPDAAPVPELTAPTAEELRALAEPSGLAEEDRRRILSALRLVAAGDPWVLLGVPRGTDKRAIKRAFFERSKQFHPDRFYARDTGAYDDRLHTVFEAISRAHGDLSGDGARRRTPADAVTAPQSPAEYAAELFDRACVAEVSGDPTQALKLFSAAVKLDSQSRYLRRAAVCAMAANELRAAEDYAKKAAVLEGSSPSTARILGKVLRLLGKLDLAEEVLVMALAMKSENDTLMMELAADLRAVRADLAR